MRFVKGMFSLIVALWGLATIFIFVPSLANYHWFDELFTGHHMLASCAIVLLIVAAVFAGLDMMRPVSDWPIWLLYAIVFAGTALALAHGMTTHGRYAFNERSAWLTLAGLTLFNAIPIASGWRIFQWGHTRLRALGSEPAYGH